MSDQAVIDQLEAAVLTHAPDSRLIANVRAVDIHAMIVELRALRKLRDAAIQAVQDMEDYGSYEVTEETGDLLARLVSEAKQEDA